MAFKNKCKYVIMLLEGTRESKRRRCAIHYATGKTYLKNETTEKMIMLTDIIVYTR